MPTYGSQKLHYPNSTDAPDVAGEFLTLNTRIDRMLGAGVALAMNLAGRNAYASAADTYEGFLVLQADTGIVWRWTSGAWTVFEAAQNSQRRAAVQSIATSATAQNVISWDTAVTPLTAVFTLSAGVFTCAQAGVFEVVATADFAANATGNRAIYIRKNGTPILGGANSVTGMAASIDACLTLYSTVTLAVSDTLDIAVGQSSGSGLNVQGVVTINQIG